MVNSLENRETRDVYTCATGMLPYDGDVDNVGLPGGSQGAKRVRLPGLSLRLPV